ncbi:hypothetical protein D3C85_179250 [compost metagenome]
MVSDTWYRVADRLPAYGAPVRIRNHLGVVQEQTFFREGADDGPDWWQDLAQVGEPIEIEPGDHWMPWPIPSAPV